MRISYVVAAVLGTLAAACTGTIDGGGDDVQTGPDCGNGVVDAGETCDDSNITSGDGCSSVCTTEQAAVPKLNLALDKTMINTELNTDNMVTVMLTGEGGFGGNVTLTGSVVDGAGAALTGWTVTFNQSSLSVPTNGVAMAVATVHVPSENSGLMGTLKIDAASSLPSLSATSTITALNQVSVAITNNGTQCVYPAAPVRVKVGTKLRFVNNFATATTVVIHSNGAAGVDHESDPPAGGSAQNEAYEQMTTSAGTVEWYCHSPGPNPLTDPAFQVVN